MYESPSIFAELGVQLLTNAELTALSKRANRGKVTNYALDLGCWIKDVLDYSWIGMGFSDEVPTFQTYNRLRSYLYRQGFPNQWTIDNVGHSPAGRSSAEIADQIVMKINEGVRE